MLKCKMLMLQSQNSSTKIDIKQVVSNIGRWPTMEFTTTQKLSLPHYNGSRSKNNQFHPEGLQALNRLYTEDTTVPTRRTGWTTIPRALEIRVASHLQPFPNLAKNVHGGVDWFPGNATMIYLVPPSCQLNGQINHNQLLTLPPPFVICGLYGWLLGLSIPTNGP